MITAMRETLRNALAGDGWHPTLVQLAVAGALDEVRTSALLERRTTEGQRKHWDGDPDLSDEGWFPLSWERFDYTEEIEWVRVKAEKPPRFEAKEFAHEWVVIDTTLAATLGVIGRFPNGVYALQVASMLNGIYR